MQFLNDTRGASSTVTYTLIVGLVVATAGGGMVVVQGLQGTAESQIEAQQFVVDKEAAAGGNHYSLVYIGSETLSDENTDVLEVSSDSGQILTTPDDWNGNNLSQGDTVVEDLTTEFSVGEEVNIIKYSNAEIDGSSVASVESSQRLQRVIVRETDPSSLDGEGIGEGNLSDILVDDTTASDNNVTINVD